LAGKIWQPFQAKNGWTPPDKIFYEKKLFVIEIAAFISYFFP
jgi:hypothetical protein